jgi:hypothetical protein
MHEEAESAKETAPCALYHWHSNMKFDPTNTIEELEDRTARVLAVLKGHCEKALARSTSQQLV